MSIVTQPVQGEDKIVDDEVSADTTPSLGPRVWLVPAVLLVIVGALAFTNLRHDSAADGGLEARKVVVTHVEELLSYDHKEIEEDLAGEQDWLTGPFADEYQSLVRDKIAPAAKKAEVVTDAKVSSSGVVKAERHSVELLLFVNVTTRSSELAESKTAGSRLVVTADWVDGAWRISSLEPV